MRRYHLCRDPAGGGEATLVETASGRISLKRKRNARLSGRVLLRDTIASRTTDRTGRIAPVEDILSETGLERLSTFEKRQTKIPFALGNGTAFLISFDHCFAGDGPILDQIELEHIGTTEGAAPSLAAVADDLEALGARLLAGALGPRLRPSEGSKYAFFSAQPARLRAS